MTAHTPGPWTVRPGVYDTNSETACEFPHGPEVIANDETIAFCQLNGEVDARLIAAAPEMLDYCKLMAANGDPDAIELVAKAEGRQ